MQIPSEITALFDQPADATRRFATVFLDATRSTEQGADEGDETTEDGDRGRDDVGGEGDSAGEAEPGDPVLGGVVVQVVGAAKGADEEVLGGDLGFVSADSIRG